MGSSAATERAQPLWDWGSLVGQGPPSPLWTHGAAPRVLALHGFGGTPREVALVVDVATELGLGAGAPLLPGHGTHASELAAARWPDWYQAAEAALDELSDDDTPAVVVGLSLGSLLAIHLAALRPERVAAVALLANACWLSPRLDRVLGIHRALRLPDVWLPKSGPDLADAEARHTHLTYRVHPLRAASEVRAAGVRARALLPRVTAPVLLAHGRFDRTCPCDNARRVADRLIRARPQVLYLERSRHVITRDVDRDQLRHTLREFILEVSPPR